MGIAVERAGRRALGAGRVRYDAPVVVAGFHEAVIAIGDRIRVQGLALVEEHAAGEQLYREGPRRIRIIAHPAHPLTIGRR
jgi:hypothetical protein